MFGRYIYEKPYIRTFRCRFIRGCRGIRWTDRYRCRYLNVTHADEETENITHKKIKQTKKFKLHTGRRGVNYVSEPVNFLCSICVVLVICSFLILFCTLFEIFFFFGNDEQNRACEQPSNDIPTTCVGSQKANSRRRPYKQQQKLHDSRATHTGALMVMP